MSDGLTASCVLLIAAVGAVLAWQIGDAAKATRELARETSGLTQEASITASATARMATASERTLAAGQVKPSVSHSVAS